MTYRGVGLKTVELSLPTPESGYRFQTVLTLEADAVVLDARIRNGDEPDSLVASADVGNVDAEHFQAFFELLNGEIVLVQHVGDPF